METCPGDILRYILLPRCDAVSLINLTGVSRRIRAIALPMFARRNLGYAFGKYWVTDKFSFVRACHYGNVDLVYQYALLVSVVSVHDIVRTLHLNRVDIVDTLFTKCSQRGIGTLRRIYKLSNSDQIDSRACDTIRLRCLLTLAMIIRNLMMARRSLALREGIKD